MGVGRDEGGASFTSDDLRALHPALLAYARRSASPLSVAQDLVQEALLAATVARAPFEGRARLRTWLIGILSHKIADHYRAAARSAAALEGEDFVLAITPAGYASPESAAARAQALDALQRALPSLPPLERLAVLSVDVEGLEHDEVAKALDVTTNHLRVLLHRGRHRLRKAVEDAHL